MLTYFNANQKNSLKKLQSFLGRRKLRQSSQSTLVKKIISDVRKNGDKALIKYEKKFSSKKSNSNKIKFSKNEINKISKTINKKLKFSIDLAFKRIKL